jgi:hypothetical protein
MKSILMYVIIIAAILAIPAVVLFYDSSPKILCIQAEGAQSRKTGLTLDSLTKKLKQQGRTVRRVNSTELRTEDYRFIMQRNDDGDLIVVRIFGPDQSRLDPCIFFSVLQR